MAELEPKAEGTSDIFTEEEVKATLYRKQWDSRIAYRSNQLRRFSGSLEAFTLIWENWRVIYDPTNYISNVPGEEGSYLTPYDFDDNGAISSTNVRLHGTRHASDQNDRPHGA